MSPNQAQKIVQLLETKASLVSTMGLDDKSLRISVDEAEMRTLATQGVSSSTIAESGLFKVNWDNSSVGSFNWNGLTELASRAVNNSLQR